MVETTDVEDELLLLVDQYLAGASTFTEFESKFIDAFFFEGSERVDALPDERMEWFSAIAEWSSYSSVELKPDDPDRQHGLRTAGEFKDWLQDHRAAFPLGVEWR